MLLLVSMGVSVLDSPFPSSPGTWSPSSTYQLWIFDADGFVLAVLLMNTGSLGDRIGRRLLLLIGAAAGEPQTEVGEDLAACGPQPARPGRGMSGDPCPASRTDARPERHVELALGSKKERKLHESTNRERPHFQGIVG